MTEPKIALPARVSLDTHAKSTGYRGGAPIETTAYEETTRLLSKTLRTVGVLVAVTVVFVGALSAAAVFVTSRAVGASAPAASAEPTPSAPSAKKPLSI